ncbi:MAG: hypothetical protein HZC10_01545 [Nitrospirae bacterium]|nr:hypothetical protein [Nitrospirota bacterium]
MLNKYLFAIAAAICTLIFITAGEAQPLHSVMLTVPDHPEEALNWCGPATGQMIMEGYPAGSCTKLQEDIWMAVQGYKTEAMWDTDPVGLKEAMKHLCPPAGTWSVHAKTDPQAVMYDVAYWMTKNNYPAAGLLNTLSHNAYTSHGEHWVAIRGIITDKDPTLPGNTSVNLQFIWFNDPSPVNLGDPSVERFVSGSQWYSEFQPVAKVGSGYQGKYVAVIEPPEIKGKAISPAEVLIGKVITPEDAMKYAAKWIEEYKLYEMEPYKILRKTSALTPLLVNKSHGGYYIIPYAVEEKSAHAAIIINAYTGNFQEVGAFKPAAYMPKEEAINIALKHLGVEKPKKADAELIFPIGEQTVSRYFPIWKVTADRKVLGVDHQGKIYTKIPREDFSIPLPGLKPQGITWDGKHLWAIDEQAKKLNGFDSHSGAVIRSFNVVLKRPSGLTFDGKALWIADEETKSIHAVNPDTGEVVKTIKMEIPPEKGFKSFEGIAWDGKYLWTAIYAGFSSSFNQIDTENGRIVRSIFADCNPRGIASDGEYLWSICYNGEKLPPKIDRRKILEKEHEMLRSRVFIKDIEERDPTGLVYDGLYLWYADRISKRAFRVYPGNVEKK